MTLSDSVKSPRRETTAYERWELPDIGKSANSKLDANAELPTAAEIESIQKQAYSEGHERGYRDGHAKGLTQGETEIRQKAKAFEGLIQTLDTPFDELDEQVIEQTAQLAIAVARQIIRRELHTDPGQVVAVVRDALKALPVMARKIRVFLHPDDAVLVREMLSLPDDDDSQTWRIIEDPLLSRGGCKINSENSTIDASVEMRLQRVITGIMGGERVRDG
ncbi:MAG TPA: flagellar assembly protein FliH [Gammaproteobacteria bacterium]|nr:flagellar assembly protein FliH [Gammaproteobacteria bacterium]